MTTMNDLTANWLTPEFFQNPYPYYAALRGQAPVYWSAKLQMWLTSNYPLTLVALGLTRRLGWVICYLLLGKRKSG